MRFALVLLAIIVAAFAQAETFVAEGYDPGSLTPEMLAATEVIAKALEGIAPEGWNPQGGVERYTTANMYGKINGRSELFMSYSVKGMAWLGLSNSTNPDLGIEVYIYDQGSTLGAFGVYSVERWQESLPVKVGAEGYRSGSDLFFRKGHYYITILGSEEDEQIAKAQDDIARKLAERLADDATPLWGDEALPKEQRAPNSLKYFQTDAMSLDFLKNTFVAEIGAEEKITHFISRFPDDTGAASAYAAYEKYLSSYGGKAESIGEGPDKVLVGDLGGGYFDVVFQEGKDLAGVTAVKSREGAIAAVAKLRAHLRRQQ